MEGTKSLLYSHTFWGLVVSIAGKIAAVFGYTVTEGTEQEIVAAVSLLASGIGDIYALFGRIRATKVIVK